MRFTPHLHIRDVRAGDAQESLFIELCTLRRSLIDLKPGVSDEADYAAFRSFFANEDARITLMCNTSGAIEGFLGWHMRPLDAPGVRVVVIDSDYFFMKASLRGHAVLTQTALNTYVRSAWRYRRAGAVIVGHGYPSSVLSGSRFSDRVRFLQDRDVAPWEREAMLHFVERYCGDSFDREPGLVQMRTIPAEPRRLPRSARARAVYARIERYNPHWTEGWGLPYVIHLSPASIAKGALRFALG
jgi:hypothetical protein